jgi:hypothetical protein
MSRSLLFFIITLIFSQNFATPNPAKAESETTPIFATSTTVNPSDRRLNETEIRKILNEIVSANRQKNAIAATQFMAPSITSINRFIMPKQTLNTIVYSKSEHLADLEGEFAGTNSYNYHSYQAKVNVSPDQKYASSLENYLLDVSLLTGERVLFAIASRSKFVLIDGEPRILQVTSTVEMENPSSFLSRSTYRY